MQFDLNTWTPFCADSFCLWVKISADECNIPVRTIKKLALTCKYMSTPNGDYLNTRNHLLYTCRNLLTIYVFAF